MAYNPNDPTPKWIQEVGGHECSKHGRYYGSCASCASDEKEQRRRTELERGYVARDWARRWKRAAKSLRRTVDLQIKERDHYAKLRAQLALAKEWLAAYDKTGPDNGPSLTEHECAERFRAEVEKG